MNKKVGMLLQKSTATRGVGLFLHVTCTSNDIIPHHCSAGKAALACGLAPLDRIDCLLVMKIKWSLDINTGEVEQSEAARARRLAGATVVGDDVIASTVT